MNNSELRLLLSKENFDPMSYRILENPDESTWCLERKGKTWLVFYFERGTKWELNRFKDEGAACEYFYNRIVHG
jgi:hypothetical protein